MPEREKRPSLSSDDVQALHQALAGTPTLHPEGRVHAVTGLSLRATLPGARVGDVIEIYRRGTPLLGEIVGFSDAEVIAMPLGGLTGVGPDDLVRSTGAPLEIAVGPGLLGRVLDGLGRPYDDRPLPDGLSHAQVDRSAPSALARRPITTPLITGIRAIDGFLTLGIGQRVGLFSGSGVGKSTLLGAMTRGANADVIVVALVGERGREVSEFVDTGLGSSRDRAVVVVATSDAPALERLRAAQVATTIAEDFRDRGQSVLLVVDSITRVARAQREVGLASGEPPARRGFPPSVFAMLPRLLERAGPSQRGAITAVYTVLVEGDDLDEPVADEVRGTLDGHIVLSRSLANRAHYPAIDIPASVSRVMPAVVPAGQAEAARWVRAALALYSEKRDLIVLGGYETGTDPFLDRAIAAMPAIDGFLQQNPDEVTRLEETQAGLSRLAQGLSR